MLLPHIGGANLDNIYIIELTGFDSQLSSVVSPKEKMGWMAGLVGRIAEV